MGWEGASATLLGQTDHLWVRNYKVNIWHSSGPLGYYFNPAGLLPDWSVCLPYWLLAVFTLLATEHFSHFGIPTLHSSPPCWAAEAKLRLEGPRVRKGYGLFLKPPSCSFLCFYLIRQGLGTGEWDEAGDMTHTVWGCKPRSVVVVSVGNTDQVLVRG